MKQKFHRIDQSGDDTPTANDLEVQQLQDEANISGRTGLLSALECDTRVLPTSDLTKWRSTLFKACWLMAHFIFNIFKMWYLMC